MKLAKSTSQAIEKAFIVEKMLLNEPQVYIPIDHFIHDGVYIRTATVPKDVMIVGAAIKIPTTLIISGDCIMTTDKNSVRISGYNVFQAECGRKQIFLALTKTSITMIFKTNSATVEEAEKEFTDQFAELQTAKGMLCQA